MKSLIIVLLIGIVVLSPVPVSAVDSDLSWLQGHWCFDAGDEQVEEFWLSSASGETVGVGRTLVAGKMSSFEYMRITHDGSTAVFTAQPGGRAPTDFKSTSMGKNWIVFENLQHDFPQRVEYRREADALKASISGPAQDSEALSFDFDYHPCP